VFGIVICEPRQCGTAMPIHILAADFGVPPEKLPAFREVCEATGNRGASHWEELLGKVRSTFEVEQRISGRPELLSAVDGSDERTVGRAKEQLKYWGRYSAKVGTTLDEALDLAAEGIATGLSIAAAGKLRLRISMAIADDEHLNCQGQAFPYRFNPMVAHGRQVIEARPAEDFGVVAAGTLLGYISLDSFGYIGEIAVIPQYQGRGVATALVVAAASAVTANGGQIMCVDIRSGNQPAINMFKALGFKLSSLEHPGFFDWDGGYYCEATAKDVAKHVPANAEIIIERCVVDFVAGMSN